MKKTDHFKDHSGLYILIIIIIAVLIFLLAVLYFSPVVFKDTEVSLVDVEFNPKFVLSLGKGCLTNVNGSVKNIGENEANEAYVICTLIGSGTANITSAKNIGFIRQNDVKSFEMMINNDCPSPVDIECKVNCRNCKHAAYG